MAASYLFETLVFERQESCTKSRRRWNDSKETIRLQQGVLRSLTLLLLLTIDAVNGELLCSYRFTVFSVLLSVTTGFFNVVTSKLYVPLSNKWMNVYLTIIYIYRYTLRYIGTISKNYQFDKCSRVQIKWH